MTPRLSNRQHDAIEAARERMTSAALRGSISPPMLPPGLLDSLAATADYYDGPAEVEEQRIDGPASGRSTVEEHAWRQLDMAPAAIQRRDAEAAALEQLDRLREDRLREDGLPETRSREPVRRDVRANFYWQARG